MSLVRAPDATAISQMPMKTTSNVSFEPAKPILPRMLELHKSLGKTGDRAAHNVLDRLEHERGKLQVWGKQQIDHLLVVANRTWLENTWSVLKTVADSVISVVSFAMGGYFLSQGNTSAGNALIASGVVNILQTVFARPGMWDWISKTLEEQNETHRNRLKVSFPIIVSLLGMAFSVAGHRMIPPLPPIELVKILEQCKGAIAIAAQGSRSYLSIKKGYDDAQLPGIQGALKQHELSTDLLSRFLDSMLKESRRIKSAIKTPINALMQATTLASQKV